MQAGPLDAVAGVEAIGKALLELLKYVALAVSAGGDEFDVGQGQADGGHGVSP